MDYVPARGDLVWLEGDRPALVVSPREYNRKVGLALLCPITSQVKGYPFEVSLPEGSSVTGVVLADRIKSLDWRACQAKRAGDVPNEVFDQVLDKLGTLLGR